MRLKHKTLRQLIREEVLREVSLRQVEELASSIQDSIQKIDPSADYKTLAQAVAIVLEEHYGEHNLQDFLSEVKHFFNYRSVKPEGLRRR